MKNFFFIIFPKIVSTFVSMSLEYNKHYGLFNTKDILTFYFFNKFPVTIIQHSEEKQNRNSKTYVIKREYIFVVTYVKD